MGTEAHYVRKNALYFAIIGLISDRRQQNTGFEIAEPRAMGSAGSSPIESATRQQETSQGVRETTARSLVNGRVT